MSAMPSRRFLILATVLVLLNAGLWLAPGALALRQAVTSALFGPRLMRADVTLINGAEWRLDRGIVTSNTQTPTPTLTLKEADTKVQAITVSSATKVTIAANGTPFKLRNIRAGWRVLVQWPAAGGPAVSVVIEKRSS